MPRDSVRPHPQRPRLLVLDTAYALDTIRRRSLERAVTVRDLDGWFEHVWSVHPLLGADDAAGAGDVTGPMQATELAPGHTVLEAPIARFSWLRRVAPLNLLASQLGVLRRLSRLVARERIDVIRAGDPYYLGILGLVLARRHRVPLVIRVNGNYDAIHEAIGALAYPRLFRRRSIEKRIDRFVLPRADAVVAPNRDNLDFALRNGADPARSTVFPFGNLIHAAHWTDPAARGSVRSDLGDVAAGDRPLVTYVCRLEQVKHPDHLVDVAARLRDEAVDAVVVLVGDGSMRGDLERTIAARGLADRVVLAGSRDQEWIAAVLAESSVIAAPHNGRALVEAALSGRPIVAYDIDWHRELLDGDALGVLVDDGDVAAMAAAVATFLRDPALADRVGVAARAAACERMEPARLIEHERDTYAAVLGRRR